MIYYFNFILLNRRYASKPDLLWRKMRACILAILEEQKTKDRYRL